MNEPIVFVTVTDRNGQKFSFRRDSLISFKEYYVGSVKEAAGHNSVTLHFGAGHSVNLECSWQDVIDALGAHERAQQEAFFERMDKFEKAVINGVAADLASPEWDERAIP